MDALAGMPTEFECFLVETEYWGQMTQPNLMVEISPTDLAELISATTFHVGEVNRNPFHLLMPAWMMDNVRRGSELVGARVKQPQTSHLLRSIGFVDGVRARSSMCYRGVQIFPPTLM
jgi:hypothetical protein